MKALAKVLIDGVILKHGVYSHEDTVSYSNNGAFLATACSQAMVKGRVIASLHPNGGPSNFDKHRTQPGIPWPVLPLLRFPALSLLPGHIFAHEAR